MLSQFVSQDLVVRNRTLLIDALLNYWPSGEYKMKFYAMAKSGEPILWLEFSGLLSKKISDENKKRSSS